MQPCTHDPCGRNPHSVAGPVAVDDAVMMLAMPDHKRLADLISMQLLSMVRPCASPALHGAPWCSPALHGAPLRLPCVRLLSMVRLRPPARARAMQHASVVCLMASSVCAKGCSMTQRMHMP